MKKYVAVIDQSTSASKAYLVDARGEVAREASLPHAQYYPLPGYVEHDAEEIFQNVRSVLSTVLNGVDTAEVAALSITNQRETTVLWDARTGAPLCHAIVWQDVRGEGLCEQMSEHAQAVWEKTGLPLGPYFSAAKAACALRDDANVQQAAREGVLRIGTIDSYLLYRLTGGAVHATDVSNAARTQLFSLRDLAWDDELCAWFGIDRAWLPEVLPSDAVFGETRCEGLPRGLTIAGVMGDSHAALFGHGCLTRGSAKATFGTGSSVMLNTGDTPFFSRHGLQTTVGFQFRGKVCYAMEGNVLSAGDTLRWLQDGLRLFADMDEMQQLLTSVPDAGGVYLVPAFTGLGSPHNDSAARALLCGIGRDATRAHIVRAAIDSLAFQDADILAAMALDTGDAAGSLHVDGGAAKNDILLQRLSDLAGCPVLRAADGNLSALGAAMMGGLATGLYQDAETLLGGRQSGSFAPKMPLPQRDQLMQEWRAAVRRARNLDC